MKILALDVGEKRIGIAEAKGLIAVPLVTIAPTELPQTLSAAAPDLIVVGLPRNASGQPTAQTTFVRQFAASTLQKYNLVFQDESLTSVLATEQLEATGRPFVKADIDKQAAAIILQDYLERNASESHA
jgi:putative transcription antitermination factor YqgF